MERRGFNLEQTGHFWTFAGVVKMEAGGGESSCVSQTRVQYSASLCARNVVLHSYFKNRHLNKESTYVDGFFKCLAKHSVFARLPNDSHCLITKARTENELIGLVQGVPTLSHKEWKFMLDTNDSGRVSHIACNYPLHVKYRTSNRGIISRVGAAGRSRCGAVEDTF